MTDPQITDDEIKQLKEMLESRKYRDLGIPPETLISLYQQALANGLPSRKAFQSVKKKLHNIVAPYLEEASSEPLFEDLEKAFQSGDPDTIQAACTGILASHASTRERFTILKDFYPKIFAITGIPGELLDLACGLNPFAFRWMGLPRTVKYHAYDLNLPRIERINRYFTLEGLQPLGTHQDILIDPPSIKGDIAFLFKEAHRLEQRQRGCNRQLWRAINVRWLLVSLPSNSLSGRHDLAAKHRRLVMETCSGMPWKINEIVFPGEIVFCIEKGMG